MEERPMTTVSPKTLRQGDLQLLDSDLAQRLLASTELARLAYVTHDGTPRVLPMLFHWTGPRDRFFDVRRRPQDCCSTRRARRGNHH
jgi:hypothetical protein